MDSNRHILPRFGSALWCILVGVVVTTAGMIGTGHYARLWMPGVGLVATLLAPLVNRLIYGLDPVAPDALEE